MQIKIIRVSFYSWFSPSILAEKTTTTALILLFNIRWGQNGDSESSDITYSIELDMQETRFSTVYTAAEISLTQLLKSAIYYIMGI